MPGDPILAARSRIAALKIERQRITQALSPIDDVLSLIPDAIAATAAARPSLSIAEVLAGGLPDLGRMMRDHPAATIAWLLPDVLADRLEDAVSQAYTGALVLSGAERRAKLEKLDRDILAQELVEERAIRAVESSGVDVDRREDADTRAVLATLED
jgi:hypothetical protein